MPNRTPDWERRRNRVTTRWPEPRPGQEWDARLRVHGAELQEAWGFLGRLPWDVMATLTFDPKKGFPVGRARAEREAWWWCTLLGRLFRRPVGWLYATERGRGGLWHIHALVAGARGVSWTAPVEAWVARNGAADVRPVWEGCGAVLYTTKTVREGGEVTVSDTLTRYQDQARPLAVVELFPVASPPKTMASGAPGAAAAPEEQ